MRKVNNFYSSNNRMLLNWDKYLAYLLFKTLTFNLFIIKNISKNSVDCASLFIKGNGYLSFFINLKLSSFFYYTQSLDSLSYEQLFYGGRVVLNIIYITNIQLTLSIYTLIGRGDLIDSLENFFYNFWWFEREISELFGLFFKNKRDVRNLLLEYNNIYKPMIRTFPSIGVYELYYSFINQTMVHVKLSVQI